ncbi:zinc-dependent metalloprotease [Caulobacter sp. 17J80-11]|uniref:zinc-dependent metalloprotease n=1 Tax=Caulobacter sp. 17J80-11 TaxID=2763502 RepID=UPI0016535178|nr:zinc-dependent metalloprotease [Caulobacter sp. 17J80-11]MBC6981873.1 zinc-dependent metalloprotease [Caulobacter sp. 17J80-11]
MNTKTLLAACASVLALSMAAPAFAADAPKPFAEVVKDMKAEVGLLPVYVDAKQGKILLSLPKPDAQGVSAKYLYFTALRTGLGSAPVGLDRAKTSDAQVLVFRRVGKKVVAELENPRFRAANAPADEQAAARDAFAYSTLWAGEVVSENPDGRLLVDISSFLNRDAMGVADTLKQAGENGWKMVGDLTMADPSAVKVFPENLEFEARQTFASDTPGPEVRNIAPDPRQITLVVRHSLVKLPDDGYQPRRFDPRAGGFSTQVLDYAAPLGQPIVQDFANRFRLEKTDPKAARSTVKKPIVFYVDRSAPEPIRSALVEGAAWWAKAFEDAGYIDAFKVEVLPEGVDPLDVRYNVINWVNRATRGWSYGQSLVDPRTGEIVKGSVLLGSLRVRQDMLIFEGLVGADKVGTGGPNDPVQVSLARIRQLSAHETGHAIGLAHNFAASTQGRASVMDYPAPRLNVKDGEIDLSDAYGVGVGRWDDFAIDWLYGDAPEAQQPAKALAGVKEGLRYISDSDSRAASTGQPYGSIWDDGTDPAAELSRMMDVRKTALARFGVNALHTNEPAANLRRKFVPIWLVHRYQVEAAAKLVGGVDYAYAVKGDGRESARAVPAADQRKALASLLDTLKPEALDVPEAIVPLLSSGWSGAYDRQFDIEIFRTAGEGVFDPLAASEAAANQTLNALLAPERLNRAADQHRRDETSPGADEIVQKLIDATFAAPSGEPHRLGDVRRRVARQAALQLAAASRDTDLAAGVSADIDQRLHELAGKLAKRGGDPAERAWAQSLSRLLSDREALDAALKDQAKARVPVPPGMPIGAGEADWMGDL